MKGLVAVLSAVSGSLILAGHSFAQVFPPSTANDTTITNIKADLALWGGAVIGIALVVMALSKVKSVAR